MTDLKLLSNGTYHAMMTARGGGFGRWKGLAMTRWREDNSLADGGTYLYLREDTDGAVWSAAAEPVRSNADAVVVDFDSTPALWMRFHADIESTMSAAVATDDDVEVRRLRIRNVSRRPRSLCVTSYAEIVLAPAAADAAHLAFSKLFVETEIDAARGTIFATRRPSANEEPRAWLFHAAVVDGQRAPASYETDRTQFIGRGRDTAHPAALGHSRELTGHAGPVLDAVVAIRVPLVLEAGASCTVDWFTGLADTRPGCDALATRVALAGAADRILEQSLRQRDATLRRLGVEASQARVYERLAARVLYADSAFRAPASTIEANRRGQASLWKFGISGDVPIVLLRMAPDTPAVLAEQFARAHAYWRAHGLVVDAMILVAGAAARLEQVRRATAAIVGNQLPARQGSLLVQDDATVDATERTLLLSVARIAIEGAVGDLGAFLQDRRETAPATTTLRSASAANPFIAPPDPDCPTTSEFDQHALVAFNGHGGFSADLREYVIGATADRMTPLPWTNVIANPEFGTLISECGSATTWSENAHEFRLTPWSNDPVGDANTEALYIRDEDSGGFWSPTLLPTRRVGEYVTRHGFGESSFTHVEAGIESTLRVFVAIDAPIKFSVLTLCNRSGRRRRLSVTGYVEWVLGDERAKTLLHVVSQFDASSGAIFATNGYNTDFAGRTAFFVADFQDGPTSVCADRREFFGPSGSLAAPAALAEPELSGRVGAALDPCAAVRVRVDLAPGESREVVFRLGAGRTAQQARVLVENGRAAGTAAHALDAVRAYWRRTLGTIRVATPERSVDALVNGWLQYQVTAARLWGRTAFYQSSGAYGFRDQLQDVMALVHAEPALVREHLLRAASRQFVEGDVQHWWHPPSGKGVRTRCSDDYLWLPLATARYVEVTADTAVLDAGCAFLDSRALRDGEVSDYATPAVTAQQASLYEHCVRAIRHGLRYGAHGLPLMEAGDWNDGMNLVGVEGRGESVWLAFFLIAVLKRFAPLARRHADAAFAAYCENEAAALAERVEATSWDGAWYRRAYFDDGTPLGTADGTECRIDSIAQSWAVISGAAPSGRAVTAMQSVHRHLMRRDAHVVQLLDPPFDISRPTPGYIQGYVPGVRENGGQYTHAAVWVALAWALLGNADRAWEVFEFIDPLRHGASAGGIAVYKVEPYVIAGDVYARAPHTGRGGWTWYTGSAGWLYQVLLEALLGVERCGSQLRIRPLLPAHWPGFELNYRYGTTVYEIACQRAASSADAGVTIDGAAAADGAIPLRDDGRIHAVVVRISPEAAASQKVRIEHVVGEEECNSE